MRQEQVSDKMLVCRDCGSEFVFSKEKGFEKEPVRCPACRKARKQEKTGQKGR